MHLALDAVWLQTTALAGVRITAFVWIAPPFSYRAIPARVRGMLAVGLALAVSGVTGTGGDTLTVGAFTAALLLQLVTGALLGFFVMVCFSAVQAAGSLIDVFGGFQMAQAFDPYSLVNGAQFTRLFQMSALVLLFTSGGHQLIIAGLARSFSAVPVDGVFEVAGPAELVTGTVSQLMLAAVQIAGPIMLVLFLADVGLGLITRVAPALNAFAMGFPIKILLTLILAGTVYAALPTIVDALSTNALHLLQGVRP